jgi:ribonuclease P/MRP protein subunit POP1
MREDSTSTVTSRNRTPSAKLRLRLENAKALKHLNAKRKTVRQRKKEAKSNAKISDPAQHVTTTHVPRVKKNKPAEAPRATTKFKRRQVNKTWLPTHLWHTKRSHMTRPAEPLWRLAIPLSPTEKSYRASHRSAGSRGCVAWDMSYISTIACLGTCAALESMLKAIKFGGKEWSGSQHEKWKAGTRFATSWICENGKHQDPIAPIEVIWASQPHHIDSIESMVSTDLEDPDIHMVNGIHKSKRRKVELDRRLFIRVHASTFAQVWAECVSVAKMQKPQVLMEDLRFEIGSIDVTGPDRCVEGFRSFKPSRKDLAHPRSCVESSLITN